MLFYFTLKPQRKIYLLRCHYCHSRHLYYLMLIFLHAPPTLCFIFFFIFPRRAVLPPAPFSSLMPLLLHFQRAVPPPKCAARFSRRPMKDERCHCRYFRLPSPPSPPTELKAAAAASQAHARRPAPFRHVSFYHASSFHHMPFSF